MSKKLTGLMKQSLSYCDPTVKKAFHAAGRATLRAVVKDLGLAKAAYNIRSNMGGIAVSGEVTLHTDEVYVQISQFYTDRRGTEVMYRACDGQKDYCGKQNYFMSVDGLEDVHNFAERLRTLMGGRS